MANTEVTLKATFLLGLAALAFLAAGIGTGTARGETTRNMGPGEAQALIRENAGKKDFVVLDVRTPGEFAQGHIKGAVLVDYRSPAFREEMAGRDRAKTYLVYCRTGKPGRGGDLGLTAAAATAATTAAGVAAPLQGDDVTASYNFV